MVFQENQSSQPDFSGYEYILERQLKPEARQDIVRLLKEKGIKPTAMMDVSDGLSSEVLHICHDSGLGCKIYEDKLPIDYQTYKMAEELNMNATVCALSGGEDYELLNCCLPPRWKISRNYPPWKESASSGIPAPKAKDIT